MRLMVLIALLFGVILLSLGGLSYYASRPALSSSELAPSGILEFPQYRSERVPQQTLKVVTYNIGYASGKKNNQGHVLTPKEHQDNLNRLAELLKTLSPDILCLQEVDFSARRSFQQNQMQALADALQMPYAAYVITWNKRYIAWPYWPPQRHFGPVVSGQAVLSRYPIEGQDLLHFAKPAENPLWYNWFYLDRIAQRLAIKVGDLQVFVWNIHLEAFDEITRTQQLDVLAKIVQKEAKPSLIIAGDYNTDRLSAFMKTTGLKESRGDLPHATFPSWEPTDAIDHILFEGFQLKAAGIPGGNTASDHLPAWAEFSFRNPGP